MTLERNERKAVARRQDAPLDRGFERVVVRGDLPAQIALGFEEHRRDRLAARQPHLHGAVVDGIGRAQNFRRRVGRVLVHADLWQVGVAPGLVVAMQRMRDAGRGRAAVG